MHSHRAQGQDQDQGGALLREEAPPSARVPREVARGDQDPDLYGEDVFFMWEDSSNVLGGGDSHMSVLSPFGSLNTEVALEQAINVIGKLSSRVQRLELRHEKAMERSLTRRFQQMKGEYKADIEASRRSETEAPSNIFARGAPRDGSLYPIKRDRLVEDVKASCGLSRYVTHPELAAKDFVNGERLANAIPTPTILPPCVDTHELRIQDLEKDLTAEEGTRCVFASRTSRIGRTATQLPSLDIPFGISPMWRHGLLSREWMRSASTPRIGRCSSWIAPRVTVAQGLSTRAAAKKAKFKTVRGAVTALSFDICHLELVLHVSKKEKDAENEGLVFTAPFSSFKIFEGTTTTGTYKKLKGKLFTNRGQRQKDIDLNFPPNQTRTIMTNAILSDILRVGYYQAVAWLDAFAPYYNTLIQGGMKDKVAWGLGGQSSGHVHHHR